MPVVTITRQLGSDGDEIGRTLAERLGYRYLDSQGIAQAMRAYGGDIEPSAPEIQEKQPSFWERLNEERRRHSILLRSAVYSFALEDDCLIVGVGASMLLKGLNHVLKALTIAPLDTRVRRVMEQAPSGQLDQESGLQAVRPELERFGAVRDPRQLYALDRRSE